MKIIKIKKLIAVMLTAVLSASVMTACTNASAFADSINVVSREDGSGTRGAFIELFGIEEKNTDGKKVDYTTDESQVTNNTAVMMATVSGNENAIGYISLGSLNNTVTAAKIDNAEATAANVQNGTYKIARPFNIATKAEISTVTQDFIDFILSKEGQAVVSKHYIGNDNAVPYAGTKPSGKIVAAGSSSVTPVMELLKEAYLAINPNASIEIQQSDSTTGMTSAIEGICDIGMASRELKESEIEKGLTSTVIATDGIVVIVNNNNSHNSLTSEQVKEIYTGEISKWSELDYTS